jgi:type I restriction-modification system DNA methylase subunit
MSKHALSRIYEKYVMLLRPESEGEQEQFGFFGTVPTAVMPKKTGTVYTPQFIAGFFGRFIRENTTPKTFRDMRFVDPACGSGLFLRTILELQCDPFGPGVTRASIERAFSLVEGIDRDPNACEATRLSLALLHLIATGILPRSADLKIRNQDAISAILREQLRLASFGAVITNPPYIKLDHLPQADRQLYNEYLGRTSGRVDAYIPFTKLCLDLVKPAGFVCLVLPQTFLTAGNAAELRKRICRDFDILCLVDLSEFRFLKVSARTRFC